MSANIIAEEKRTAARPAAKQRRVAVKRAVVELDDSFEGQDVEGNQDSEQPLHLRSQEQNQFEDITNTSLATITQSTNTNLINDKRTRYSHARKPSAYELPL